MQLGNIALDQAQGTGLLVSIAAVTTLYFGARSVEGRLRVVLTMVTVLAVAVGTIYWVGMLAPSVEVAINVLKALIALTATACVFYEIDRVRRRRPIAERWKKFVGITLGVASILVYFNGFRGIYVNLWHRHEHYHYYLGSKYFHATPQQSLNCTPNRGGQQSLSDCSTYRPGHTAD